MSFIVEAQVRQLESLDPNASFSSSASSIRVVNFYEGTQGHPYLFDRWEVGELVLNGVTYKDAAMKYNILKDELMIMNPITNDSLIPNREKLENFIIYTQNNRKFKKYTLHDKTQFLEVLFEGKVNLLKKWKKTFIQADKDVTYNSGKFYNEYDLKTQLFIEKDGKITKIKSKNSLLEVLGSSQSKIKHYADKQHLDLKDEPDLLEVLKYYESLE